VFLGVALWVVSAVVSNDMGYFAAWRCLVARNTRLRHRRGRLWHPEGLREDGVEVELLNEGPPIPYSDLPEDALDMVLHHVLGDTLKERSASQSHFIELCRLVGQSTPTEADPTGDFYTFGRGAEKSALSPADG